MTIPNGPDLSGTHTDPSQPQPPSNSKPSSWASVPRSVLVGGAAAVAAVVVVVILVISLNGGSGGSGDDSDTGSGAGSGVTTSAAQFVPNVGNAEFGEPWRDKKTNEIVTPPQHIKITDSVDLTEKIESIGYGTNEQSLPKLAKNAATDTSFPSNPAIKMFASTDGTLRLNWRCETYSRHPASANCQDGYSLTVDVTGSVPAVVDASANNGESAPESKTSQGVSVQNMAVADPEELPASALGTDKGTGATTVLMLGAVQPRESSAKVYFLVPDSLKLYVGELESSR